MVVLCVILMIIFVTIIEWLRHSHANSKTMNL